MPIALVAALVPGRAPALPSGFRLTTLASLSFPTGLQFSASGKLLFVNERAGRVRLFRGGHVQSTPFATVATTTSGEGGLLGLALDPKFESGRPWVYVFFTLPDGSADRVERFRYNGSAQAVSHQILISRMPANPSSSYHHGGILAFGRDGTLYVTNGEAHDQSRAQNPKVFGGKIYRINAN